MSIYAPEERSATTIQPRRRWQPVVRPEEPARCRVGLGLPPVLRIGPKNPHFLRHEAPAFRAVVKMFYGTVVLLQWRNPKHFRPFSCDEVSLAVIEHCPQLNTASRYILVFLLPVLARLSRGNGHRFRGNGHRTPLRNQP
jgi:hypothetical protein